eukprot:gene29086-38513_t
MKGKNGSSSIQSEKITGKALRKSKCLRSSEDWKDIILSYSSASNGLRSITSQWKLFSPDETLSLAVILDVNQRGFVSWNDLCILGEMIYDVYRCDAAHPVRAYKILYKSILQSLYNMCGTVMDSSTVDKIMKVASSAREQNFQPLQLFEEYLLKSQTSSGNLHTDDESIDWAAEFFTKLLLRTQESRDSHSRIQLSSHTVTSSLADSISKLSAISVGTVDSAGSFRFLKNAKLMMSTDTPSTTRLHHLGTATTTGASNLRNYSFCNEQDETMESAMQPVRKGVEKEEESGEEKKESHMSSPLSVFQIAETSSSYYDNDSAFDLNAVHNTS